MNVLVAADMEGIAGIDDFRQCLPSHPAAYARGRELMTGEVRAVCEALCDAGAERVVVGDWHMVGTNIERDRVGDGVEVRPIAGLALEEERPSFAAAAGGPLDGVVFVGHHAGTRNPRGFSSHTFMWEMEVTLDGEPLSEVRTYAQALAGEGIPVLLAAGDRWMLEELDEGELGGALLIAAKEGEGRARARSRDVEAVRRELAAAIAESVAAPPAPPPARSYPAQLRVSVEGEEIASATVAGPDQLLTEVARIFRAGAVAREYRQLAALLPPSTSARRRLHRRAGALLATPVMRRKERRWIAAAPAGAAA